MAFIHIFTGPMASGKTSSLLNTLHRYSNVVKEPVLLVNFSGDDRGSEEHGVSTHQYGDYNMRLPLGKYIDPVKVSTLGDISDELLSKYNMIGIDEAHFYPDLKEFIEKNFRRKGLKIYVSGLSYDSDNNKFGQISDLLPLATTFEKMAAICSVCDPKNMVPAGFTHYTGSKDSVVKIGGLESYDPRCTSHYFDL